MSYYVLFRMLKHPAHRGGPTHWMLKGHGTSTSGNSYPHAERQTAEQEASFLRDTYVTMQPEVKVMVFASDRLAKAHLKELNK